MNTTWMQLCNSGMIEHKIFGDRTAYFDSRDMQEVYSIKGNNMQYTVQRIGDTIANFIFEMDFPEEMNEENFYKSIKSFQLKIGNIPIWNIAGEYFWRNVCIKREHIAGERKKWFLTIKMKELILNEMRKFNLIALKNYDATISLELKQEVKMRLFVDYFFYKLGFREKLWKGEEKFQILQPKVVKQEIQDEVVILPKMGKLFADCFWIKFPQNFVDVKINGEPFIQDHYGNGLYWVQWKPEYSDGIMYIPCKGEVIMYFDKIKNAEIKEEKFMLKD